MTTLEDTQAARIVELEQWKALHETSSITYEQAKENIETLHREREKAESALAESERLRGEALDALCSDRNTVEAALGDYPANDGWASYVATLIEEFREAGVAQKRELAEEKNASLLGVEQRDERIAELEAEVRVVDLEHAARLAGKEPMSTEEMEDAHNWLRVNAPLNVAEYLTAWQLGIRSKNDRALKAERDLAEAREAGEARRLDLVEVLGVMEMAASGLRKGSGENHNVGVARLLEKACVAISGRHRVAPAEQGEGK